MRKKIFSMLKYLLSVSFAVLLLWYVYKDQNAETMLAAFRKVDFKWVIFSILISLISHLSRGWRWSIALKPLGYQVPIYQSFLAVMVGYFGNIFVPRIGEVVRCGVLKKMNQTPIEVSFGTVLTERIFDMIILMAITALVLVAEFDKIGTFLVQQITKAFPLIYDKLIFIAVLSLICLFTLIILFLKRQLFRHLTLYQKIQRFFTGIKKGFLSIKKLDRPTQLHYLIHTLIIWMMYYLMCYVIFFSMEETANLGMLAAGTVMIMAGLGMVVPTPGGTGSYHLFVGFTLAAYGLTKYTGKNFAFLMHSSQLVAIFLTGGLSFVLILLFSRKKEQNA